MQDSKDNKGELFGISNLFRDLSEEAFTSEIIEEHDKRILSYASNGNRARNDKGLTISQRRNARALDGTDSSGKLSQPCKNQAAQKNKVASVLRNAGVFLLNPFMSLIVCFPACFIVYFSRQS